MHHLCTTSNSSIRKSSIAPLGDHRLRFASCVTRCGTFMEHLTGRRAEKALGKSAVELFPSSRENLIEAALNHAFREK